MGFFEKERNPLTNSIMVGNVKFTWDETEEIKAGPSFKTHTDEEKQANSEENDAGSLPIR